MLIPEQDFEFFNPYARVEMSCSNLPHWQQPRCLYFVTFRLYDSLPQQKLNDWNIGHKNWLARNPKPWDEKQFEEYLEHFARKIEHWLDQDHGSCLLKKPESKEAVLDTLQHSNGTRYKLDSYTVAANHVHVLIAPEHEQPLPSILKSWKGVSARKINQALNRDGTVWQKESYDHIVRNAQSLERIRRYIARHDA